MRLLSICLLVILGGCSHPLQIHGQGDIVSASGARDCLYDTYSAHTDPTTEPCPNTVVAAYQEVYSAAPRSGWTFDGWTNCPSDTEECSFNVPATAVAKFWGSEAPPLVANFSKTWLLERIAHRVVDASFIRQSDTLVMLGDDSTLYVYDATMRETQSLSLQGPGSVLSVSPDGAKAVVGHNGYISYIDLTTMQVEKLYPITTDVFDIVLPGNGYIYVASGEFGNTTHLRIVNLQTGEETESTGEISRGGATTLTLHPSGDFIYGTESYGNGASYIKYDIRESIVDGDDRPHGFFPGSPHCGKMWPTEDGLRAITGCGYRNHVSDDAFQDMTRNGWLGYPDPPQDIRDLSQFENEILFIEDSTPTVIARNSYPSLVVTEAETLPSVTVEGQAYPLQGRFIFHKSDGSYLVIVQADEASGLSRDFAIVHRWSDSLPVNVRPYAITPGRLYADIGTSVTLDGTESFDAEGAELTYFWQLVETPAQSSAYVESPTSATTTITPDVVGEYQLELVVNDGEISSHLAELTVVMEDPADSEVFDLGFSVTDAAYSPSLNQVVMIATAPDRIVQFDLASGETSEVLLPAAGDHIDVAPAGRIAAVTHGSTEQVSIVDLEQGIINHTYTISKPVGDVVLSSNDYVHTFHPLDGSYPDFFSSGIWTINLLTGVVSDKEGSKMVGMLAKLHPSGEFFYGVLRDTMPSDIISFDVRSGAPVEYSELPYHGDFALCGNLWLSPDGTSIYTACGNIFAANPDDMRYTGHLEVAGIIASLAQNQEAIAVLHDEPYEIGMVDERNYLDIYDAVTRSFVRRMELPLFETETGEYSSHGRYVFYSASGSTLAVIVQPDVNSGLVNHSLWRKR